jgi:DNA-binding response OmpR family regulator
VRDILEAAARHGVTGLHAGVAGAGQRMLDLRMPKLNGFDVLARLREMPVRPRLIVLSGHAREEGVTGAFDLGADDYLTKPAVAV